MYVFRGVKYLFSDNETYLSAKDEASWLLTMEPHPVGIYDALKGISEEILAGSTGMQSKSGM